MEEKKPRKWYEKVIIVVVIIAVFGVIWGYVHYTNKGENEKALIYQLKTFRTTMQAYIMSNKERPTKLQDLASFQVQDANGNVQKFSLDGITVSEDGKYVDSFGNPFVYNVTTGDVNTSTKGYESW